LFELAVGKMQKNRKRGENVTEENGLTESQKDQELMANLRRPQRGVPQQLLCQNLFMANFSTDNHLIVFYSCRAVRIASTLAELNKEPIKDVNGETFDRMLKVLQVLEKPQIIEFNGKYLYQIGWTYDKCLRLHWGFIHDGTDKPKVYEEYVKPWVNLNFDYWPHLLTEKAKENRTTVMCKKCNFQILNESDADLKQLMKEKKVETVEDYVYKVYGRTKQQEEVYRNPNWQARAYSNEPQYLRGIVEHEWVQCPNCGILLGLDNLEVKKDLDIAWNRPHDYFFAATWVLKEAGYDKLKTCFYQWAVPLCGDATTKLAQYVNSDTYNEVFKMMTKQYRENQEKEAKKGEAFLDSAA
jgi:hypothetical protein